MVSVCCSQYVEATSEWTPTSWPVECLQAMLELVSEVHRILSWNWLHTQGESVWNVPVHHEMVRINQNLQNRMERVICNWKKKKQPLWVHVIQTDDRSNTHPYQEKKDPVLGHSNQFPAKHPVSSWLHLQGSDSFYHPSWTCVRGLSSSPRRPFGWYGSVRVHVLKKKRKKKKGYPPTSARRESISVR